MSNVLINIIGWSIALFSCTVTFLIGFDVGRDSKKSCEWHTGTPTEEGDYIVAYTWALDMAKTIHYEVCFFSQGHWVNIACKVLAWREIKPYNLGGK